jgi:hypothetical protein
VQHPGQDDLVRGGVLLVCHLPQHLQAPLVICTLVLRAECSLGPRICSAEQGGISQQRDLPVAAVIEQVIVGSQLRPEVRPGLGAQVGVSLLDAAVFRPPVSPAAPVRLSTARR